jgi:hypothetical protein
MASSVLHATVSSTSIATTIDYSSVWPFIRIQLMLVLDTELAGWVPIKHAANTSEGRLKLHMCSWVIGIIKSLADDGLRHNSVDGNCVRRQRVQGARRPQQLVTVLLKP